MSFQCGLYEAQQDYSLLVEWSVSQDYGVKIVIFVFHPTQIHTIHFNLEANTSFICIPQMIHMISIYTTYGWTLNKRVLLVRFMFYPRGQDCTKDCNSNITSLRLVEESIRQAVANSTVHKTIEFSPHAKPWQMLGVK